jgi:hypothetical protein
MSWLVVPASPKYFMMPWGAGAPYPAPEDLNKKINIYFQ